MAVRIFLDSALNNKRFSKLVESYSTAAEILDLNFRNDIETKPINIYIMKRNNDVSVNISWQANSGKNLLFTERVFVDGVDSVPILNNTSFILNKQLSGNGISNIINKAGVDSLKKLTGGTVTTTINNDNGYTWLRKGFTPENVQQIKDSVLNSNISKDKKNKILQMQEKQLKSFLFTPEFNEYRNAFKNVSWNLSLDINNNDSVRAYLSEYASQQTARLANANINLDLRNAYLRHQIATLRVSKGLSESLVTFLNDGEEELANRIRIFKKTDGVFGTPQSRKRLNTLINDITTIRAGTWKGIKKELLDESFEILQTEAQTITGLINTVSPTVVNAGLPPLNALNFIIDSTPFEGKLLKDWADDLEVADVRRITAQVRQGVAFGETNDQILNRVFGTASRAGRDGIVDKSKASIRAVTRTAIQHINNNVRREIALLNTDILKEEIYSATLDGNTTPICRSLDGDVFDVGVGPQPPLHFSCRSFRRPIWNGQLLGNRPSKPVTERMLVRRYARINDFGNIDKRGDLPFGHKTSFDKWSRGQIRKMAGPVAATETYETFLRSQSFELQKDVLGVTKAKLFRDGGLTLDKYVHRNGDELTIKELARWNKDAFVKAGLDPETFLN